MSSNVTAGEVVSATRKYSNKDNAGRKFNISADVNISNGKVTSINNGTFTKADEPTNGSGNFSKGENWMSVNFNNFSEYSIKEAFEAILDFEKDVNESVNSLSEE